MAKKMPDSTQPGVTRSSYHPTSVNGDDFAELVWQNSQILVQRRGPSSNRQKGSSCIRYSENPSHDIGYDEGVCITKRVRLNTSCSLFASSLKNFDMDSTHQESQQSNDHQHYQFDLPHTKSKNSCKHIVDTHLMVEDECPDFRRGKKSELNGGALQLASFGNSEFYSSSSQRFPASASFITPRIPIPSSQKQDLRTVEKVNFPNFVRPTEFLKSTNQGSRATKQTGSVYAIHDVKEIKTSKDDDNKSAAATSSKTPEHSIVNDSSNKHSHSLKQEQNANQVPLVAKSSDREPLPDERSEAMRNNSALGIHGSQDSSLAVNRAKGKLDAYLCDEQLFPSSSVCSVGASNDPTYLSRKYKVEDTYDSAYSSENDEEEEPHREGARCKRSRKAEIRNLSEKKRRYKINKKMRALKELIPNCNKMDNASMLDDAIEHLKTLKLQLQIMSLGTGMCMPFMILPAGANHLNPLHLSQFPQLGTGIGLRPSIVTPGNLPQFPPPQPGPASLPGITDNRLQIPTGFPNQILPISIPHAPFIPMLGKPFTQPVLSITTPSNLVQHLASSPLPTLKDPVPNAAELNAQPECPYVQYK